MPMMPPPGSQGPPPGPPMGGPPMGGPPPGGDMGGGGQPPEGTMEMLKQLVAALRTLPPTLLVQVFKMAIQGREGEMAGGQPPGAGGPPVDVSATQDPRAMAAKAMTEEG